MAHTPKGGKIFIEAVKGDGSIFIKIRDTGCGIAEEHLPFVFDRLFRVDVSRVLDENHGSGLGLSIVDTIARLHKGSVEIESEPGNGTTVSIYFPYFE